MSRFGKIAWLPEQVQVAIGQEILNFTLGGGRFPGPHLSERKHDRNIVNRLTPTAQQQRAIAARGNVLVVAGAGAGKTQTWWIAAWPGCWMKEWRLHRRDFDGDFHPGGGDGDASSSPAKPGGGAGAGGTPAPLRCAWPNKWRCWTPRTSALCTVFATTWSAAISTIWAWIRGRAFCRRNRARLLERQASMLV